MELDEEKSALLLNKKIGGEIDGSLIGLSGYTLKITGGCDASGFPLDRSVQTQGKLKVMKVQRRKGREPAFRRMTVRGNLITSDTKEISAIITTYGSKPLEELFPKKAKEEKQVEAK